MTELEIWTTFWIGVAGNGIYFVGLAFLTWVGLRVGNNIRNSEDSNMVIKIAGSAFCLTIAFFMLMNGAWMEWHANGVAGALSSLAAVGEGSQEFIANANPGAKFDLMPELPQAIFLLSVLTLQLGLIWSPKD